MKGLRPSGLEVLWAGSLEGRMKMYCLSKREFKKDRLKVLVLGLIIGISIGICVGFVWGTVTLDNLIKTAITQIPQQMSGIQF
jgi:hypothetical protein